MTRTQKRTQDYVTVEHKNARYTVVHMMSATLASTPVSTHDNPAAAFEAAGAYAQENGLPADIAYDLRAKLRVAAQSAQTCVLCGEVRVVDAEHLCSNCASVYGGLL